MRVSLLPLAAAGLLALAAPATAADEPGKTVTCLAEAPGTIVADPKGTLAPDSLLDPATAPGLSCLVS